MVFITSKPIDAFLKGKWEPGSSSCRSPIDASSRTTIFRRSSTPTTIRTCRKRANGSRPSPCPPFSPPTIGATTTDRYRRVARFVEHLFSRIDKLQAPGFDPKWKDINLNAKVPGLERFRAAQEWLNANTATVGMRR